MKNDKKIKYYTYQLNMVLLNILAIVLLFVIGTLVYWLEYQDNYVMNYSLITLFIMMFLWLILHEILHAIAFVLFKEVNKENVTFGMFLEKGVFYCMCKQKIKRKVILTSLLFPVTIIGVITLIIGMLLNNYELVFLSILNIVSSIGDLVMTIYFLKVPKDITYLDLDDCTSFTVLSQENLTSIKVPGIILVKEGYYDEQTMSPKDKRKLVISKASRYLIIFIGLLAIVSIIKKLIP